jgi:GNAT superfamily N-acetyltransferase
MQITQVETDEQIDATFDVMRQLRPDLVREMYVARIRTLMATDGFRLAALTEQGEPRALAGYRYMNMLYCGRILYIDDLVTDDRVRSRGYGKRMLDWLKSEARRHECSEVQLISRVIREQAHRFYFREDFGIECFQFRMRL